MKNEEIKVIAENSIPKDDFFATVFPIHGKPKRVVMTHNQLYNTDLSSRFLMILNEGHFKTDGESINFKIKHGKGTIRKGKLISHNKTQCGKIAFRLILSEWNETNWVLCIPDSNFEEVAEETA